MKRIGLLIAFVLLLASCSIPDEEGNEVGETDRIYAVDKTNIFGYRILVVVDRETGCEYMLSTGEGSDIEPVINPDGSFKCKKK